MLDEIRSKKGVLMNKKLLLVCAVVCLGGVPLMAQEVSAGITGRVTDPSGAAIVGASVTGQVLSM